MRDILRCIPFMRKEKGFAYENDWTSRSQKKERLLSFSQLKVSFALNISREALSYYENGKRSPDIDMLIKHSDYFAVFIDYLIRGKEFSSRHDAQIK